MKLKKLILSLHGWIGLISGLVVFIVSITGAIYVFEKELFAYFNPNYCQVTIPRSTPVLPLSTLMKNAQETTEHPITTIRLPGSDEQRQSYIFESRKRRPKNKTVGLFIDKDIIYWDRIFVDPYSGKVLGKIDVKKDFFLIVRQIHQFLYLRRDIGSFIVGSSVLLFMLTMISGLILWWPKNRKLAVKRMKIDSTSKKKRLNYDLHQVLGFYSFSVALLIAATGLVWSFKWWEGSIYWMLDGKRPDKNMAAPPLIDIRQNSSKASPLDAIWIDIQRNYQLHHGAYLNLLPDVQQANVTVHYNGKTWWSASDTYAYHLQDGKQYFKHLQNEKTLGMKWRNSNYDIHVGKIAGFPGMCIAFIASLICASLPVTGFFIWYGRKFKRNKTKAHLF